VKLSFLFDDPTVKTKALSTKKSETAVCPSRINDEKGF